MGLNLLRCRCVVDLRTSKVSRKKRQQARAKGRRQTAHIAHVDGAAINRLLVLIHRDVSARIASPCSLLGIRSGRHFPQLCRFSFHLGDCGGTEVQEKLSVISKSVSRLTSSLHSRELCRFSFLVRLASLR